MRISIIGYGNVGSHLSEWLEEEHEVCSISARTLENLPSESDVIIIASKDDAIPVIAEKIKGKARLVAHTSGSVPRNVLNGTAPLTGVFYPLQTFTKGVEMNRHEVPVFLEGNDKEAIKILSDIAHTFTDNIYLANSEKRKKLHIAAVFACNFTNALVGMADSLLKEDDYGYSVLLPLINQTIGKLSTTSPEKAQTGPAVRGDKGIVESHIRMLQPHPDLQEIYRMLSDYIMKSHKDNQI